LEQWREEQGIGSDEDEQAWKDWEAQSDDSESSGGWVNVESDGEEIDISDSEDEKPKKAPKADGLAQKDSDKENKTVRFAIDDDQAPGAVDRNTEPAEPEIALKREEARISNLATTRILTPADLSKLQELRTQAAITANMPSAKRRKLQQQAAIARHVDDEVTADHIEGLAKLGLKATKEEKIRMAKGDPDEKNDHRSTTARRVEKKASEGKSTTNKEKARKKNFLMTLGKAKHKGKRSLVEHRKILKAHVDRSRKGGRRGNK
jgi:protein SDA1